MYQLKLAFLQSLALFYSESLGSLQVTVRKLLARGFISRTEVGEGRRVKKLYRVEAAGREAFFAGMRAEIPQTRLEVTALARLHFLGLLPPGERRAVLDLIVEAISASLAGPEEMKRGLDGLQVPAAQRTVFRFQLKTLEYGIMSHRAGLEWFRALRKAGS